VIPSRDNRSLLYGNQDLASYPTRVAGERCQKCKGLVGHAMCKSSLIPQAMEIFLWKAVCSETGLYRLGRGQQKRSERNLAGALLHSGRDGWKRLSNGTSLAVYSTPDYSSQADQEARIWQSQIRPVTATSASCRLMSFSNNATSLPSVDVVADSAPEFLIYQPYRHLSSPCRLIRLKMAERCQPKERPLRHHQRMLFCLRPPVPLITQSQGEPTFPR